MNFCNHDVGCQKGVTLHKRMVTSRHRALEGIRDSHEGIAWSGPLWAILGRRGSDQPKAGNSLSKSDSGALRDRKILPQTSPSRWLPFSTTHRKCRHDPDKASLRDPSTDSRTDFGLGNRLEKSVLATAHTLYTGGNQISAPRAWSPKRKVNKTLRSKYRVHEWRFFAVPQKCINAALNTSVVHF